MNFKVLFSDDRAVSPVIGVILMVAITVILAAVIGTFVLGLGDQVQQTTPQASFGFDTEDTGSDGTPDIVTATHESGDTINGDNVQLKIGGQSFDWGGTVSAGSSVSVGDNTDASSADHNLNGDAPTEIAGETLRIVFDSPDSDNTATLGQFEVPS